MNGGWLIVLAVGAVMVLAIVAAARTRVGGGVTLHAVSPSAGDPWLEFLRELQRSRRTERPLTLMRLDGSVAPIASLQAAQWLAANIREVDRVWIDEGSIFLLLPETDTASTTTIVERLVSSCPKAIIGRRLGWANFPSDALTSDELVRRAEDRLEPVRLTGSVGLPAPAVDPPEAPVPLRAMPGGVVGDQRAAGQGRR